MDDPDEILAIVSPSPPRLWLALAMTVGLGVLLLSVALRMPGGAFLWQLIVSAAGGVSLWMAYCIYQAAGLRIEMTGAEVRDSAGRTIAKIDEISGVERGAFAFKPSNGFLIRTKKPGPRFWAPGVWWRMGRSVGVGGITPGHEAKAMADQLTILLSRRDGGSPG